MSLLSSVRGLVRSEEDLATTALAHVLRSHRAVSEAFNGLLGIPLGATWGTQEHLDDGEGSRGRPDLVARIGGVHHAFVEAKFGAGLTDAQPTKYLRMLGTDGVLLFLIPAARLAHLEPLVLRRASEMPGAVTRHAPDASGLRRATVAFGNGDSCDLFFITWDDLLRTLLDAAKRSASEQARADLEQIESLVRQIEGEAFRPFTSEQLTSVDIPRFNLQIRSLLRDLLDALPARGYVRSGNLTTIGSGWTGATIVKSDLRWSVFESWNSWQRFGHSPVWLTLDEKDRSDHRPRLDVWLEDAAFSAVRLDHWKPPTVAAPIPIRPEADRQEVLELMIDRVDLLVGRATVGREDITDSSQP